MDVSNVSDKKTVSNAFVKEILKKNVTEDPIFEQRVTIEHLNKFVKLNAKEGENLVKDLMSLDLPRFREEIAHKLVEIMPEKEPDVKVIMQSFALNYNSDNMKKILDVVAKYKQ